MSFGPKGERLITGGTDAITRMWRVDGMKELWKHKGHAKTNYASAFQPTGKLAATADAAGRVCVWDVKKGRPIHTFEAGGRLNGMAFSADGKRLYGGGIPGVLVWDIGTGRRLSDLAGSEESVRSMHVVTARGLLAASSSSGVRLFDLKTGRLLRTISQGKEVVYPVALHPTAALVAAGSKSGKVLLWNTETGKLLQTQPAHTGGTILGLAFRPDGKVLATGGADKLVRLWKLRVGVEQEAR